MDLYSNALQLCVKFKHFPLCVYSAPLCGNLLVWKFAADNVPVMQCLISGECSICKYFIMFVIE